MPELVLDREHKGLAGVVVDESAISDVQSTGSLIFRGHAISELVNWEFSEVAALVVDGQRSDELGELLKVHANLSVKQMDHILLLNRTTHPMRVLQGMVPLLVDEATSLDPRERGLIVAAKLPAIVAVHLTGSKVHLDATLPYAERFLSAINEESPDSVAAFNVAQILQLEHSLNAGTFAARVVASTLADIECAISAGIGALSGPLHGGADQAAIEIADSLSDQTSIQTYVKEALERGEKIPGMGHREYRVKDPRAMHLERWAERLSAGTEQEDVFNKLRMLESEIAAVMKLKGKDVHANVEFYKGVVYRSIGLPNNFFTAGFAMARVFGYVAHFLESRADNRIFRPQARYVGADHVSA